MEIQARRRLMGAQGSFDLTVDLRVSLNTLVALYGCSGAGKTTLLRMIAGLDHPHEGVIRVDGQTWFDHTRKICVPPQKRSVGFVFQNYALFPSMTVRRNLEFAAGRRRDPRVDQLLEMVELQELQKRYPGELSGGQQQRVALARALIRRPKILLLDEPLSALDEAMRVKLQGEILKLHKELGLTTLLVSHDRAEILRMADRVYSMGYGRLVPEELQSNGAVNDWSALPACVRGEAVRMFSDNGSVAIVVAGLGGAPEMEIRVEERQLRRLYEEGIGRGQAAAPKSG